MTKAKEDTNAILVETGERITQVREQSEIDLQAVLTEEQKKKLKEIPAEQVEEEEEVVRVIKSKY